MQPVQQALSDSLIERDAEVNAIMLGLLAREHVLFVGPPGTAKSLLCRSVAEAVSGMDYCERLLAPTSPPEALFGPISISALRDDRYEHVGRGTVTDCHLAFLDEVFRGSDAILDTLLHLLGPERQALIGTQQVQVPLMTAVGATNTWPDNAHQQALFDRWLIRRAIRPVSPQGRSRLLFDDLPAVTPQATLAELLDAQHEVDEATISDAAQQCMSKIMEELHVAGIRPSDRRCRKSLQVARAAAVLAGESTVEPHHLECLGDVLWDEPNEQPEKASGIVSQLANPVGAKLNEILREVDQLVSAITDQSERLAAVKKLEQCEKDVEKLQTTGNGRAGKCLMYVRRERVRLQAAALGIDPKRAEALMNT